MTRLLPASALMLTTMAALAADASAQGVDIWTVGVDNTLEVTACGKPNPTSPNVERNNMLWVA